MGGTSPGPEEDQIYIALSKLIAITTDIEVQWKLPNTQHMYEGLLIAPQGELQQWLRTEADQQCITIVEDAIHRGPGEITLFLPIPPHVTQAAERSMREGLSDEKHKRTILGHLLTYPSCNFPPLPDSLLPVLMML